MAYRLPAQLPGKVVLLSKLGPRCCPLQHGALGWHAGITAYRLQGVAIGQAVAYPLDRLGRVEAGAAPLFLHCYYQWAGVIDPLGVWWAVVVPVDRGFSDHRDTPSHARASARTGAVIRLKLSRTHPGLPSI